MNGEAPLIKGRWEYPGDVQRTAGQQGERWRRSSVKWGQPGPKIPPGELRVEWRREARGRQEAREGRVVLSQATQHGRHGVADVRCP